MTAAPPTVLDDAFERAGLVPHETTHSRWSVTVSTDAARPDSGQALTAKVTVCAACGSHDTRCVHTDGVFGKEQWRTIELHCAECGVFSSWHWEAW